MKFFQSKKQKQREIDVAFERVYEKIHAIDDWDDPKKLEHYILDSCEQIIATTKEIEREKSEYRTLTAYLNDIKIIEELPTTRRKEIKEVAANIVELNKARDEYLQGKKTLTEEQFVLLEENEDEVPFIIRRMQENERYQASVKKDMLYLEGQKSQWEIEREQLGKERKILRQASILLSLFTVTVVVLIFSMEQALKIDLNWAFLSSLIVAGLLCFFIYIRITIVGRNLSKALYRMNQSISLLNVVRMKYVNVTNGIQYIQEKFGVENSYELNYMWEQYLSAVREQQQYERNNSDYEFFVGRLQRMLKPLELHDAKIWLTQTVALIVPEEMHAVRQRLIERRQKIRERIYQNTESVRSERNEIDRLMTEHEYFVPEILEIIKSVDKLCGLSSAQNEVKQENSPSHQ